METILHANTYTHARTRIICCTRLTEIEDARKMQNNVIQTGMR